MAPKLSKAHRHGLSADLRATARRCLTLWWANNQREPAGRRRELEELQIVLEEVAVLVRLAREVGQLDFNEFVSSVNFDDEDLDLGNPDLKPEQTWVFEIAYEHRFSSIGVVEITPFYHWIDDVEDLVPLGGIYDAPGNIGDGERWGVNLKLSSGFEFIGIDNARLDIAYEWQDSSVTDPVTAEDRPLLHEQPWSTDISLRKDFPASRASIGAQYNESRIDSLDSISSLRAPSLGRCFMRPSLSESNGRNCLERCEWTDGSLPGCSTSRPLRPTQSGRSCRDLASTSGTNPRLGTYRDRFL